MSLKQPGFLPMSAAEMKRLGWEKLDILLITGDAYIDHQSFGIALIGRLLISLGFRAGVIAQPDWKNLNSLKIMGKPELACAISSGNTDSMLNIYTAGRRLRKTDDYSPGGKTGLRPSHACSVYSQLAHAAFPGIPVIIGGIEASMRRIAHYDYWQDKIRPSILVDSKADILVYGMGERAIKEIVERLAAGKSSGSIKGTARLLGKQASIKFKPDGEYISLPAFEEHLKNPEAILKSAMICESEMNPYCGRGLIQQYGDRLLVVESPAEPLNSSELDKLYELPFSGLPHPAYKEKIPAFEMIKNSITSVRGCPGGCSFCGIGLHQGKFITSRSVDSILREIRRLVKNPEFRGTISDIGGPTANTYGNYSKKTELCRKCRRVSCLFPEICPNYVPDENLMLKLLGKASKTEGVKNVFISSGLRLDLALRQRNLLREIIRGHVSGHLKVAPEHLDDDTLWLMRKNPSKDFFEFLKVFENESGKSGKEQYVVPYFISNFPGSSDEKMKTVDRFLHSLKWQLRQVQDFIPLPMTMAAAMYYAGKTPEGRNIKVNRGLRERRNQIKMLKKRR